VHASNDAELAAPVCQFPINQVARDDADRPTAARKHSIREDAHEADVAASEYERETSLDERRRKKLRRFRIDKGRTFAGPAKNAQ
jgi:hypothetical protein